MQKRSLTLMKRLDTNVESVLTQFAKMIELSSILDKSQGTLSVESLQIESNASTIIRLIEELLAITRNLKESWILGQIPTVETNEEKFMQGLDAKMNKLLNLILDEQNASDEIVVFGEESNGNAVKPEVGSETSLGAEVGSTDVVATDVSEVKLEPAEEGAIEEAIVEDAAQEAAEAVEAEEAKEKKEDPDQMNVDAKTPANEVQEISQEADGDKEEEDNNIKMEE